MGCDIPTAQRTVDAIRGKMARLKEWIAERKRFTSRTGEVWTSWQGQPARCRPVHTMEFTDNVAVNTPIQGGASDYCLASVVEIERWLEADGLSDHAELVGTVHDSILILARERYAPEVGSGAAAIMEGWTRKDSPVRLEVDGEMGRQWGSLGKLALVR